MNKAFTLTALTALAASTLILVPSPVRADTTSAQTARSVITQFARTTGATVTVATGLDLDRSVPVPPGLFYSRTRLMDNVAGAMNAEWHKSWTVTAAGPGKPLADPAYLRSIIESSGTVTFDATNIPAADAIASVAKADGATVVIVGQIPTSTVTMHAADMNIADAIASVSRQTNTSWSLGYLISAPAPSTTMTSMPVRQLHISNLQQYREAQARLNSPIRIHFQYPSTGPDPAIYSYIWGGQAATPGISLPSVTSTAAPINLVGNSYGYGYGAPIVFGGSTTTTGTTPAVGTSTTTIVTQPSATATTPLGPTTVTTSP